MSDRKHTPPDVDEVADTSPPKNPEYLYHGTVSRFVRSIFLHGLLPNPPYGRNWSFESEPPRAVFFAVYENMARVFAADAQTLQRFKHPSLRRQVWILLRAPAANIPRLQASAGGYQYFTHATVPREVLEIKLNGGWASLAKLDTRVVRKITRGDYSLVPAKKWRHRRVRRKSL